MAGAAMADGGGGVSALLAALRNTGVAPPQAVQTAPAASAATLDPNLWYDPSKLAAAIAAQKAAGRTEDGTANGRTVLDAQFLDSILNTQNFNPGSIKFDAGSPEHQGFRGSPGQDDWGTVEATPDQLEVNNQLHNLTKNADGTYSYTDQFDNPTGNGQKDQANIQFVYDPKTGTVKPTGTGSANQYRPSGWVDNRTLAQLAAIVGTAGIAGYAAAGAGAGEAAGGAAAGAGAGEAAGGAAAGASGGATATNSVLADSLANSAGYGASAGGGGGAAYGVGGAGLAPATNSVLADSAANSAGYGASSSGVGGGAGVGAASSAAPSVWDTLADYAKTKLTDPGTYSKLLDMYKDYAGGTGGAGGAGGGAGVGVPNTNARRAEETARKAAMLRNQNFAPQWVQP